MSEIDAPFEVIQWRTTGEKLTDAQVLERTGHSADTLIETQDFDEFFAGAIQDQDWFGAEERAIAARYRQLVALLKQHLQNLTVFQVGEVRLNIYIVGVSSTGEWMGLATEAVET